MPSVDALVEAALAVRERALAPFSRFKVGAAVLTTDGRIIAGCNVESSSYGLTMCAERSAVARAVAEGATGIVAVAVVADTSIPCPPCGACRQVLFEFGPTSSVTMVNLAGVRQTLPIAELLPGAFHAAHLPPSAAEAQATGSKR